MARHPQVQLASHELDICLIVIEPSMRSSVAVLGRIPAINLIRIIVGILGAHTATAISRRRGHHPVSLDHRLTGRVAVRVLEPHRESPPVARGMLGHRRQPMKRRWPGRPRFRKYGASGKSALSLALLRLLAHRSTARAKLPKSANSCLPPWRRNTPGGDCRLRK
jgi:hypothetical protein